MADDLEKVTIAENDEGDEDVEAHKAALPKTTLPKDDGDDDVEAHKLQPPDKTTIA